MQLNMKRSLSRVSVVLKNTILGWGCQLAAGLVAQSQQQQQARGQAAA
jgi:hypothetical protein